MIATASCHNAGQSDLGKGRRERKFWCALIRMKQSLFVSGFHFHVGISCRDFTFHVGISCRDFTFRVGISFFVSGFHSSRRDLEHQYLPFSASIKTAWVVSVDLMFTRFRSDGTNYLTTVITTRFTVPISIILLAPH